MNGINENFSLVFSVIHWIFTNGEYTEDGYQVEKSSFFVQATASDGSRWNHQHRFKVAAVASSPYQTEEDRYGPEFPSHDSLAEVDELREKCEALVAKIEAHVANGGTLDETCWTPGDPAYGSEAYQRLAVIDRPDVAEENRDRMDHGAPLIG